MSTDKENKFNQLKIKNINIMFKLLKLFFLIIGIICVYSFVKTRVLSEEQSQKLSDKLHSVASYVIDSDIDTMQDKAEEKIKKLKK